MAALLILWCAMIGAMMASSARAQFKEDRLTLVTASGRHEITIEIAETAQQKSMGLMFRTSLAMNRGMLFPYGTPQEITMWMRNTYIPLDMVFIRADGTVHRIEVKAEPLNERIIASRGAVVAVLELAGGAAESLGLKAGDKVLHKTFGTAP